MTCITGIIIHLVRRDGWGRRLFCLTFADDEFACEIAFSYLSGFFIDPALKTDFFNAAKIKDFNIMRTSGSLICRRRQVETGKIAAVAAQINALGFHTIECGTALRQMEMFAILVTTTFTGDIFFGNSNFCVDQLGKFYR
jgi:hypothetical protein